jgi:hypothetical protein
MTPLPLSSVTTAAAARAVARVLMDLCITQRDTEAP